MIDTRWLLALVVLLPWRAGAQAQGEPRLPRGTIAGEVVDATTTQPLEGATVVVTPSAAGAVLPPVAAGSALFSLARSVVTGPSGAYRFEDLPLGEYELRVHRIGYRPAVLGVRLGGPGDARVSVGLTLAPIRLHAVPVVAEPVASYGRMEAGTDRESEVRVAAARLRQRQFLAGDVRELTHPDVTEAVTLGETDLFRALQRLPGVTTRDDYTAELWTRGARADLTRLYFDGLPLFGAFHTFGLLTSVGTDAIGAAFLHPGVRPASMGDAGAAVIDVRSRPGGGAGNVRGLAELSLLSGRLALDQRARDGRSAWMVAGRRSYLDWLLNFVGWLGREGDLTYPYHFSDLAARVDHQVDADRAIEASGILTRDVVSDDVFEVLRGHHLVWGNGAARASFLSPIGRLRARHTLGLSRFGARTDTLQTESLETILTRPHQAPHYSPAEVPVRSSVLHLVANGEVEAPAGDGGPPPWSFGYGLAWQGVRMSDNVATVRLLRGDTDAPIPIDNGTWLASVWGERRWALMPRLALQTGLRLEVGPALANLGPVRPMPRLQLRFAADSQTAIAGGVGRSIQYIQALGRTEWGRDALLMASPLWVSADTAVPALVGDVGTLGVERWLGATWLVGANAYHRRTSGYVVRDPRPGVVFARQLVAGTERASGVELSVRRLAGRITGSAGYNFAVARTEAAGLAFPSSQDRRHSADVVLLARAAPGLHAGFAYTYASGAPYTRIYSATLADADGSPRMAPAWAEEPNAHRMRANASLDLLTEWSFGRGSTRWTLFVQIRNFFDRENPLVFLLYEPCDDPSLPFIQCGDRFNAGVRRIPVIGLRASF